MKGCTLILAIFLVSLTAAAHAGPKNVVLLPVPDDPTVSYRILFFAGSQYDPPGKEGLAALTARMIAEASTKQHRYEDILDLLFPMAGGYEASCSVETVVISGRIHKDNVAAFQPLLLQAIVEPAFRSEDLERIRSDMISYLENTLRYAGDEDLAKAVLYESMFAGTPYGHIPAGRVRSLKSITIDDVRAFYRCHYADRNYVIGMGGGYEAESLDSLKKGLEKLPPEQIAKPPVINTKPIKGLQVTLVEKDAPATAISIGARLDVLRGELDWYPLALANSWFGEHRNSASHLYQVIREMRGLNYGDYSYIEHFANGGQLEFPAPNDPRRQQIFEMWIRPVPHAWGHFALRAALRELQNLVYHGLTEEQEMEKRAALGKYVFHFAPTTMDRLGYAMDDNFYGIEGSHLERYRQAMQTMTRERVNQTVRNRIQCKDLQIVIITKDAKALRDALISDAASPITYPTPRPAEVLKEDEEIMKFPLHIRPKNVRIISGKTLFE
ncbi:MAG: M16 family metallopeptidase [Thermoguttaceae bacterium]